VAKPKRNLRPKTGQKKTRATGKTIEGHLYKRLKNGRYIPADDRREGNFYLEVRRGDRRALYDAKGKNIKDLPSARKAQKKIMDEINALNRRDYAIRLRERVIQADDELSAIHKQQWSPISEVWPIFRDSPFRSTYTADRLRKYTLSIERLALHPPAKYLQDIRGEEARHYLADYETRYSNSKATLNAMRGRLATIWDILQEHIDLPDNPWKRIKIRGQDNVNKQPLSRKEVLAFLDACLATTPAGAQHGDLQLLALIGLGTGQRLKDCATLQISEVDLETRLIKRVAAKTRHKKRAPVLSKIPVFDLPDQPDALYNALKQRIDNAPPTQEEVCPWSNAAYDKGPGERVYHYLDIAWQKSGIKNRHVKSPTGKNLCVKGFHSLRHTYVRSLGLADVSQALATKAVGHSNPQITQVYTSVGREEAEIISAGPERYLKEGGDKPREHLPRHVIELLKAIDPADPTSTKRIINQILGD